MGVPKNPINHYFGYQSEIPSVRPSVRPSARGWPVGGPWVAHGSPWGIVGGPRVARGGPWGPVGGPWVARGWSARPSVRPPDPWVVRGGPWVARPSVRPYRRGPWGFINKDLYKNKTFISKIEKNNFSKNIKIKKCSFFDVLPHKSRSVHPCSRGRIKFYPVNMGVPTSIYRVKH